MKHIIFLILFVTVPVSYTADTRTTKRKYISKGLGSTIRIGENLTIVPKVPFGLRARPNSYSLDIFVEEFLNHAKDAQLPIESFKMLIVIDEENRLHRHSNLFASDIEFISPNEIQAGHRSASASVDMIKRIMEYNKEYADDLKLLKSLSIDIELDIDLLPVFQDGITLYYDFIGNLSTELKNRQITRANDYGKLRAELELIVTDVKDTAWGVLYEKLYPGLIDFPDQNISYIKRNARIQVGHESYADLIDILLDDSRFDFIEGPSN